MFPEVTPLREETFRFLHLPPGAPVSWWLQSFPLSDDRRRQLPLLTLPASPSEETVPAGGARSGPAGTQPAFAASALLAPGPSGLEGHPFPF